MAMDGRELQRGGAHGGDVAASRGAGWQGQAGRGLDDVEQRLAGGCTSGY